MKRTEKNSSLIALLQYVNENSDFYKQLFSANKIDIKQIKSIADLSILPTVSKVDLQQQNSDFYCIKNSEIADIVTTSGTLGNPVTVPLSKRDLDRLANNEARSFAMAGVDSKDIIQLMVTLDMRFMAGLAYFLGVQKLGATSLRIGPGSPVIQLENIDKFKSTVLVGVPSFIAKIVDYAEQNNIDINATSVRKIICIGDAIRDENLELNSIGKRINDIWKVDLYSTYASTEMATAFTECDIAQGGHLQEDLLIVEILDDKGNNLPHGELGEVTITTLGIEGMPLVRFRTGDMAFIIDEPCACGNKSIRLSPIIGRKEQMIKLKGTTIYPSGIIDVINDCPEITNFFIEVRSDQLGMDKVSVVVGSDEGSNQCINNLAENFRSKIRVVPEIIIQSNIQVISNLNKHKGRKPKVFFDLRKGQKY
ncbi:MAG: AMP-binding protein [Bacteroidales bacterium]|nr:AMP-binding protein [Bacteroidales bacterium]